MTREQAIEKIKKLQALKEGAAKVDSDGEVKNAAAIIDKLQKQFGISMEEVYSYSSSDSEESVDEEGYEYEEEEGFSSQEEHDRYQRNVDKVCDRFYADLSKIVQDVLDRYLDTEEEERSEINRLFAQYRNKVKNNTTLRRKCENLGLDMDYFYDQVEKKSMGDYNAACKDANEYRAEKARKAQETKSEKEKTKKNLSDEITKKINSTIKKHAPWSGEAARIFIKYIRDYAICIVIGAICALIVYVVKNLPQKESAVDTIENSEYMKNLRRKAEEAKKNNVPWNKQEQEETERENITTN